MTEINRYLYSMLEKYSARDLFPHLDALIQLESILKTWASGCYIDLLESGSRAKGTAISLASDVDYLVSLTSNCNDNKGGLKGCYESLFTKLNSIYSSVRKQNVSIRINLNGLEVDITPAKKQSGSVNYHSLYVSKSGSWTQTNIQKHINDVSQSDRTNEIKILKIWRNRHQIDLPSIYLEYLLIDVILLNRSTSADSLGDNVWHVLNELAKSHGNPLFSRIVDPANSNNILSDLLTLSEKNEVIRKAQRAIVEPYWEQIIW